jgi:CheY-like chemotaxis protein
VTSAQPILIVDDDPDIRETFMDALRFEGYTVAVSEHGQQAIDWLREHGDQRWVVLLDMMMPVMDGETFLRTRAEDPGLSRFPVIVLTAGGDCRELKLRHDIAACVAKTVTLPALVAVIDGQALEPGPRPGRHP